MQKLFGLQPLEKKLNNLLKPIFQGSKKEFIIINNIVKNWSQIVGEKYSKSCSPKQLTFDKSGKNAKLTVSAHNSAIGFFLDNNSEVIIERIATLYGFKAISKIIIKQEPKNINPIRNLQITLPQSEEDTIQQKTLSIKNEDLAQILQKLGREIYNKRITKN